MTEGRRGASLVESGHKEQSYTDLQGAWQAVHLRSMVAKH